MSEKHSERRKGKRVKNVRSGISSPSNNGLDVLFQNYYDVKLAEGRAKKTLEKYRLIYGNLCKYLDIHGIGRDIRNIDRSEFIAAFKRLPFYATNWFFTVIWIIIRKIRLKIR